MQETQCPQCGDWLGVPPEFATRPVRCGSCGRVIAPHERGQPAPPPPADPRGPRFPEHEDETTHRPRPKGGAPGVWLLLAVLGFGCCGCGGLILAGLFVVNPPWEAYTPDNGAFTAEFPGKPTYSEDTAGIQWPDGTPATLHKYDAGKLGNTEWFAVHYYDLPRSKDRPSNKVLINLIVEGYKKAAPGGFNQVTSNDSPAVVHPAKDVEGTFTHPQLGPVYAYGRGLVAGDRVYMLVAVGKDRTKLAPEKDRFFNSFKPAEPKEKAK